MGLTELRISVANYFRKTVADLTINGQDMFLFTVNQVRRQAEQLNDFEFSRKLVTVSVDPITGGSLTTAVLAGTATAVEVKTVIEVGLFDDAGNLRPSEWTTIAEGLERQRADNPRTTPRWRTDAWAESGPIGQGRFQFAGPTIYRFPLSENATDPDFNLGMEVYAFSADWTTYGTTRTVTVSGTLSPNVTGVYTQIGTINGYTAYQKATSDDAIVWIGTNQWIIFPAGILDAAAEPTNGWARAAGTSLVPAGTFDPLGSSTGTATVSAVTTTGFVEDAWTTHGARYLMWAVIVEMNHYFKEFVFRQEGNLAPPTTLRDEALAAFVLWDANQYEQFRRHGR